MNDLHNPNNPEYQKELGTEFERVIEEMRNEDAEIVIEEVSKYEGKSLILSKRMKAMKKEINSLIELLENTDQTYVLNKLKAITNY